MNTGNNNQNQSQEQADQATTDSLGQGMEMDDSLNSMFDFDFDQARIDEDETDLSDYDNMGFGESTDDDQDQEGQEDDSDDDEDQSLKFDDDIQGDANTDGGAGDSSTDEDDADLADLNKRFGTDYKTMKDFKEALSGAEQEQEVSQEEKEYSDANRLVDFYQKVLDPRQTSNEDLLRRKFETELMEAGKDLNDDESQAEINSRLEDLKDTHQIDLRADLLRRDLKAEVLNPALAKKQSIEQSRTQREEQAKQTDRDQMKDALAEIFNNKQFYGVTPEQDVLQNVYKKFNSGELVKELTSDKKALAEIAVMRAYREEISKKAASGLSYNDGRKSVLSEFDESQKGKGLGSKIVGAQKKGTSGSAEKSQGLMHSLKL